MRKNDENIGKMIVKVVDELGPMGYRRHKNKVESKEYLNKILTWNTYNKWISKLRKCNILTSSRDKISRHDGKPWPGGRTIPIELTYTAKMKLKLGILTISNYEDKQKWLAELYQLILYFLGAEPGQYAYLEFRGEKQSINDILTRLFDCCSVDRLEEDEAIPDQWNDKIVRIVYKSPSSCLQIWKEVITAADTGKRGTVYHVKPLGLSVFEICVREDRPFFTNLKLTPEKVQEAFERLVDTGILEIIGDIWDATRYDLVDERLREVIRVLWGHHDLVLQEMYPLYDTKFHPKHEWRLWLKERREWLGLFQDEKELDTIIKSKNDSHEHTKKDDAKQWAELILHDYEYLKTRYTNEFSRYEFILDHLLQVAYPYFLERAVHIEEEKCKTSFRKKYPVLFDYIHEKHKHAPGSQLFIYYSDKMLEYRMRHR